jgi:gliding motility-associated-like protein
VVKWQSSVSPFSLWTDIANTLTTYSSGVLSETTQFRAVVQSGSCLSVNSTPATVTISPLTVGGTVTGGTTICSGSASDVLTLSGHTGTVVKWQSSVSPFSTWTDISSTATAFTSSALTQTTQFRAVVQSGNCPTENSSITTVTVDPASVGGNVTGGTTICTGSTSGLLSLSGQTGSVVKWQSSVAPFDTWTDIVNTATTYSSPALTQTTEFRAVVQNGNCSEATSVPGIVTVSPLSVGGTILGATTICIGSPAILTLSGQTGDVIKWQSAVAPFTSWTDIPYTSTPYTSGSLTQETQFRAVVQSGSCAPANSLPISVTISPASVGGDVTGGTTICSGTASGVLTISGQTGSVVKWQSSVAPFSAWTDIPNTSTSYTSGSLSETTEFRAIVQNAVCPEVNSTSTTVTVDPPTTGGIVSGGTAICTGSTSAVLTLSGQTGNVIKWQNSVSPFSSWTDIANTLMTYSSGVLSETTQFRAVVQSGTCLPVNSLPDTVAVSPLTVGGTVTGGTTICSGSTSDVLTLSGHTGTVVKWQSSVSPFSDWTDIASSATAFTSPALTQTTQFRAIIQSGNCPEAFSASTLVTVDPTSVGGNVAGGTTICTGSASGLLSLSGQTGTVVKWQSSVSPFSDWTDIANNATTYTSGTLTQTTAFRAVVQSGSCVEVNSASTTVTVSPLTIAGTVSGGSTICTGSISAVLTLSGQTGDVIKWQSAVAPFTSWIDISNTTTTYTSGALTQDMQFRAYVQSGGCTPDVSLPATVTISPVTIGGTITGGSTICSGSASEVLTLSGQTGTVVKWQSSVAPFTTWTDIPNTANTYTALSLTDTTSFRAVVQSGSCPEVNSASTLVDVTPSVSTPVFTLGSTSARCQGSSSVLYTASAANSTALTYSLDAASLTGGNSIDSNSGLVTYAAAWSGTSTITANAVGCNEPTMTTHIVTITSPPFATILYDTPLCNADLTEHPVVITGSAGGTFSAGEGLRINTSSGAIIPGLSSPGTYTVLYTIAAYGGCRAYSNSSQVQILSIPVMEYITVKNVTCTGSSDGSLVAKAAGAGTFIYQWTGPLSYMSTESSISGLNPGIYTLKVTNENGCSLLVTDTIAESATALSLTLNGTNPTKSGELNGKIDASIIGGTGPFTFSWTGTGSFTAATQNIVGLKYGTYNLSVTDKNGCIKTGLQILLDPPSAVDDTSSTTEDIPVTFNVVSNDFDNDGTIVPSSVDLDPLTAGQQTTFNDVNKGVFTVSATGEVTFTPVLQFFGIAAIQYIVMDNNGLLSNSATITVTVKSNNKPPIAVDDNIIIAEHNTATGNLFANDIDPEGLPLKLGSFLIGANSYLPGETATLTDIGNIIINLDGSFVYVPYQHYFGTVPPITYKVVDDEGLSALANLNITVTPVNDPPVAVDDNFTTKEHTKLEGNVLSNDYDIKGEALVLNTIPIKAPTHGSLILIASGDFIYQPIIDFVGNDTFTYQVCDNGVPPLCSTATATIVITKNDTCEVVVPNAFTPNGDGIHDYLKIRCLYKYDNSEMQIFNRNGNLLFKKEHYGNLDFWGSEEQAYWNGRSENKWNLTSDGLPVGTYYYILKLGDGKVLTGFIFLGK